MRRRLLLSASLIAACLLLALAGRASAFEGCVVTGTWQFASTQFALLEDGSGNLTGPSQLTGSRNGPDVTWTTVAGSASGTVVGTMTDCDTISATVTLIGGQVIPLTFVRVRNTYCGDGTQDPDEQCDDGNFESGDACTASCTPPECGNGILEPGNDEECDDGNTVEGDGCSNGCELTQCGNGVHEPPAEQCDDGNDVQGDGCSNDCFENVCGNSTIEPGETCDDGNTTPGDDCSALCQFEGCNVTGTWVLMSGPVVATLIEDGSGNVEGLTFDFRDDSFGTLSGVRVGPQIDATWVDDDVASPWSASMTSCNTLVGTVTVNGATIPFTSTRLRSTYCGDGNVDEDDFEVCDDGNFVHEDLCTLGCLPAECGDGIVSPANGEDCDDDNTVNGDGCTNLCTATTCGDGTPEPPGEECDDGNEQQGDGCSNDCLSNVCGNGVLEDGEQCDDGGTSSGDGCSPLCQQEGCPVTGTWDSMFNRSSLVEAPDGSFTGVVDDAQSGIGISTGTRTGLQITLETSFGGGPPVVAEGHLSACDTMVLTVHLPGGGTLTNFVVQRARSTYCGDGVEQEADGEDCDDGNFVHADACPIDCLLPNCGNGVLDPFEGCDDGNANENDACRSSCVPNVCGDGFVRTGVEQCDLGAGNTNAPDAPCRLDCTLRRCGDGVVDGGSGEECDDGNTAQADGCDTLCLEESTASDTVPENPPAPVTISTDPGGEGATPEAPVQAAVTTSIPGPVSIVVTSAADPPPSGFSLVGKQVVITASPGTVANPLTFTFVVDASQVPADPATLAVFRNGALVAECPGATQPVPDDPCVKSRTTLANGDLAIGVLTTQASTWNVGIQLSFSKDEQTCRKELRKLAGNYLKARLGGMQKCIDKVNSAKLAGTCPDPRTAATLAKAAAKIDAAKLVKKCPAALVPSLGATGACAGAADVPALAACLVAVVDARAAAMLDAEYAAPDQVLSGKPARQCQAAVAKESGFYASARLKAFATCQGLQDKGKLPSCPDDKAAAAIARAVGKLQTNVTKKCTGAAVDALAPLGFGRSCASADSLGALIACETAEHEQQVQPLVTLLP